MKKMLNLLRNHREFLVYILFGVLTTLVNYMVYLPCHNLLDFSAAVSNAIAWAAAALFAFFTNKPFVFHSHDWSVHTIFAELGKFLGTRLGSGAVETLVLLICVDLLQSDGTVWKIITGVLVVFLNYIGSKRVVFYRQK